MKTNRKVYISLLITYIGFILSYALNKYLTTHLDLEGFGDFKVGLSIASILAVLLTFGANGSVKRFIPPYIKDSQFTAVAGILKYYGSKILVMTGILLLLYAGVYFLLQLEGLQRFEHEALEAIMLAPILAATMFLGSTLQARHKAFQSMIPHEILKPAIFLVACFLWLHFYGSPSLNQIILLFAITVFTTLIIQLVFVKMALPFKVFKLKADFKKKEWNKVGLPLLYSTIANSFLVRIDILSLEIFHSSEKEIGVFSLLIFIVSIVWLNFTSLINIISPQISESKTKEDWQKIYNKGFVFMSLTNLIMGSLVIVFADEILLNFHESMLQYKFWLIVLMIAACVNSILEVASAFLRFTGHHQQAKKNTNLVMILNLVLTPLFILIYGMEGALIALVITRFVRGFNYARLMRKHVGIKPLMIT